jgi:hypothetical protein
MLIQSAYCTLVRFKCPGCGKTVTNYPDFAIPYKRYTRQTIMGLAGTYVETDKMTYQDAVMRQDGVPGYAHSDCTLAPSTIHRWITGLACLVDTCRTALSLVLQDNPVSSVCRNLTQIIVPFCKYRSETRKNQLLSCRKLMTITAFFQETFNISIFTKLAIACAFT